MPTAAGPQSPHAQPEEIGDNVLWRCHPPPLDSVRFCSSSDLSDDLQFGAAFDAGNLFYINKVGPDHFELELKFDDVKPHEVLAPGYCGSGGNSGFSLCASGEDSVSLPSGCSSREGGSPAWPRSPSAARGSGGSKDDGKASPSAQWFYFCVRCPPLEQPEAPPLTRSGLLGKLMKTPPKKKQAPPATRTVKLDIINITRPRPRAWRSDALAPASWRAAFTEDSGSGARGLPVDSALVGSPVGWQRCSYRPVWSQTAPDKAAAALIRQGIYGGDDKQYFTLSLTHRFEPVATACASGNHEWLKELEPGENRSGLGEVIFFASVLPYSVGQLHRMMHWVELASVEQPRLLVERRALVWRPPHLQVAIGGPPTDSAAMPVVSEPCDCITFTERVPPVDPRLALGDGETRRRRPMLVIFGRERPGEPAASWSLQGLLRFLCGTSRRAAAIRSAYEVVCVPMLCSGGVAAGQHRSRYEEGLEHEPDWGTPFYLGAKHSKAPTPADAFRLWLREQIAEGRKVSCIVEVRGAPAAHRGAFVCPVGDEPPRQTFTSPRLPGDDGSGGIAYSEMIRKAVWLRRSIPQRFAEYAIDLEQDWVAMAKNPRRRTSLSSIIGRELRHGARQEAPSFTLEVPAFGIMPRTALCGARLGSIGLALGLALHDCLCGPLATPGAPVAPMATPQIPLTAMPTNAKRNSDRIATENVGKPSEQDRESDTLGPMQEQKGGMLRAAEETIPWDDDEPLACAWLRMPGQSDAPAASNGFLLTTAWSDGEFESTRQEGGDSDESEEDRIKKRDPSKRPFWEVELPPETPDVSITKESSLRLPSKDGAPPDVEKRSLGPLLLLDDFDEPANERSVFSQSRKTPSHDPKTPSALIRSMSSPQSFSRKRGGLTGATPSNYERPVVLLSPSDVSMGYESPKRYVALCRGAINALEDAGDVKLTEGADAFKPPRDRDITINCSGSLVAPVLPPGVASQHLESVRSTKSDAGTPLGLGSPLVHEPSQRLTSPSNRMSQLPAEFWSLQRFMSQSSKLPPPGIRGTLGLPVAGRNIQSSPKHRTGVWEPPSRDKTRTRYKAGPWSPLAPSGGLYFQPIPLPGAPSPLRGKARTGSLPDLNSTSTPSPAARNSTETWRTSSDAFPPTPPSPLAARVPTFSEASTQHGSPTRRRRHSP